MSLQPQQWPRQRRIPSGQSSRIVSTLRVNRTRKARARAISIQAFTLGCLASRVAQNQWHIWDSTPQASRVYQSRYLSQSLEVWPILTQKSPSPLIQEGSCTLAIL